MNRRRTLTSAIGVSLVTAGALLVGRAIARDWHEVAGVLARADAVWLAVAFVFALGGMAGIALAWTEALTMIGARSSRWQALSWFFTGELAKYVPGGPWGVVGRAETATRSGVARSMAYGAVLLSMVATNLAGMLFAAGFLLIHGGGSGWTLDRAWLAFAFPVGMLLVHPAVLSRAVALLRRWSRRPLPIEIPSWSSSMRLVAMNLPAWFSIGLATWCVTRALGGGAPMSEILFAAPFSWVIGFMILPAPGGMGVREAVFAMTATSLSAGVAATVALMARILFMIADAVAAAAFGAWRWWRGMGGISPTRRGRYRRG